MWCGGGPNSKYIKINVDASFVECINAASMGVIAGTPWAMSLFVLVILLGHVLVWMKRGFGRALSASTSVLPFTSLLFWKLTVLLWLLFLANDTLDRSNLLI